jgi:hypothetical protein
MTVTAVLSRGRKGAPGQRSSDGELRLGTDQREAVARASTYT